MKLKPGTKPRAYEQSARAQATEETGRRIIDSFFGRLMRQWYDEITLDAVAAEAGVTVQTIVRRFGGKEGLLAEAVKRFSAQVEARRASPTGDVDAAVDHLFDDYEEAGDAVLRLLALESRMAVIRDVTNFGRSEHRQWVAKSMAPHLEALSSAARERMLDALVIATDVYTWKLLRRDMGRDVAAAKNTVKSLIRAALGQHTRNK